MRYLKIVTSLILALSITACTKSGDGGGGGSGGGGTNTPTNKPPREMVYKKGESVVTSLEFRNQVEVIDQIYPLYYGSLATSFSISPALPQGLQFSELSGRIAGTPEVLDVTPKTYTITASNQYGSTSSTLSISVKAQPPFGLNYNPDNLSLELNIFTSIVPMTNDGIRGGAKIVSFAISPTSLPAGMAFDPATGTIQGTPTSSFPTTLFTVTGTNSGGTTTGTIRLTVANSINSLALGAKHSCAVVNGIVKCWGDNTYGQLGDGTNASSLTAKTVSGLSSLNTESFNDVLVSGSDYNCAVVPAVQVGDSKAYCWGRNHSGQLPNLSGNKNVATAAIGSNVQSITVGRSGYGASAPASTCYKNTAQKPFCFGAFPNGNLAGMSYEIRKQDNSPVASTIQIVSGGSFFCGIDSDASKAIRCLGDNTYGQLGDNQAVGTSSLRTSVVSGIDGLNYNSLSAGTNFGCALGVSGLKCWGQNDLGQLGAASVTGASSLVPVSVEGLSATPTSVALGKAHACAVVEDKKVMCWGSNNHGQLGYGVVVANGSTNVPKKVIKEDNTELQDVIKIYSGDEHSCAIVKGLTDSGIYCWGANDAGQLGLGVSGADVSKAKKITISLD